MLRLRSTWLAGGGALLLIVALTGLAAAAPLVSDTPQGFVDLDGNGVADQCEATVAAAPVVAAAAFAAADTDGDGTISVTESAHSGWVGGKNCNHGGYVSSVANASGDACDAETPAADEGDADGDEAEEGSDGSTPAVATVGVTSPSTTTCADEPAEAPAEAPSDAAAPAPAVCPVAELVPPAADAPVDTAPNAHGKAVSAVAQSDAVGGKNCNHGGAVSEAAKKDHGAAPGAAKSNGKHASHGHGKGHKTP